MIYAALEGGSGFANRMEAWRQRNLIDGNDQGTPFYLLDVSLDLVTECRELIAAIREQAGERPIAAVAIDTLNRAGVGDENDSKDMARLIQACDLIRETFSCLVILVHHCGIAGNRPRGHTSLTGACDTQIAVEKDKESIVRSTVELMKDAEAGSVFASKLERVEVGIDVDGDPIFSCVIVPVEAAAAEPKLPKTQKFALDVLRKVIASEDAVKVAAESEPAKKGVPVGIRACRAENWRQRFYESYPGDKRDTKKKALLRATLELTNAGLIELVGEYVWLRDTRDNSDF